MYSNPIVLGPRGLVGSALVRRLQCATGDVDLTVRADTFALFDKVRPTHVYLAAAKVGGIQANIDQPWEFLTRNLDIQRNVIYACRAFRCRLLFLGSSCMYPRECPQPMTEDMLMTGKLEPTNEPYAMAKLVGLTMLEASGLAYTALVPTNLYGPGDRFHDPRNAHLVPALMVEAHTAKKEGRDMRVWGDGTVLRELMHVDDLAEACVHFMTKGNYATINVGTGQEHSVRQVAELVADAAGFTGRIVYDPSRPGGMPRKLLDSSMARALGWAPKICLRDGIGSTYRETFP